MIKAGITGGIGSGKSIVCSIFQLLGIPVYKADDAAKYLMENDSSLKSALLKNFGEMIFDENGKLKTRELATIVFSDPLKLMELNELVHPYVATDYKKWEASQRNVPYTLREAAILFESGTWKDLDFIILVDAPEELRIKRVQQRDNRSVETIKAIISQQWTSEKKRSLSHAVIINDENHLVIPQVLAIHNKLSANGVD